VHFNAVDTVSCDPMCNVIHLHASRMRLGSNNVMFPGHRPTLMLADGGDPVPAGPASLQLEQRLSGSPKMIGLHISNVLERRFANGKHLVCARVTTQSDELTWLRMSSAEALNLHTSAYNPIFLVLASSGSESWAQHAVGTAQWEGATCEVRMLTLSAHGQSRYHVQLGITHPSRPASTARSTERNVKGSHCLCLTGCIKSSRPPSSF
jgi:hypothetical protein